MALDLTPARSDDSRPADASPGVSLAERGKAADGSLVTSDRRLYMQLLAFTGARRLGPLVDAVRAAALDAVVYEDANDPRGVALLAFAEDPADLLGTVRPFVNDGPWGDLTLVPDLSLLGRTYSLGYEADLDDVLVDRPRRTVLNPAWPWAVWYPLRRAGAFSLLPADEQRRMLMEHGGIGRSFGRADLAHDVRLACHGLGRDDNDFLVGLVGPTLLGPSAVVQAMRKTQQTAQYLDRLGPFFVGRAVYQSPA